MDDDEEASAEQAAKPKTVQNNRGEYTIPLIQTVTAEQAMKTNVATCSPDDSIEETERRMTQQRRRGLPVVKDGQLVGVFTASDAMRSHQKDGGTVGQHMTTKLIVAYPPHSLHDVMQRMAEANISRLPVVDPNEQPLGLTQQWDPRGPMAGTDEDRFSSSRTTCGQRSYSRR